MRPNEQALRGLAGRFAALMVAMLAGQIWCERSADAEELLIRGMGRTLGWVVGAADGEVRFRDCRGQVVDIRDGRVDRTTQRCPATGGTVTVAGVVRAFDARSQVLVVEGPDGEAYGFFVGDLAEPSALDGLAPGVRVEIAGPFAGRASELIRR